jgi:hypothetical protein
MAARKDRAFVRRSFVLSAILGALAFIPSAPVLEAQGRRPDLEALHQRLLPLFELPGVVFTDADETSGRLVVGVQDRDIEGLIRARLRVLGVDGQSVDVVQSEPIFALASLRDKATTIVGGLQIRFSQYLCSLGFPAVRGGVTGFVTASHCSDRQGVVDGTIYYQPLDQVEADLIGTETVDPPYVRGGGACPRGKKCRQSDANFSSRATGARAFTVGEIAQTAGPGSLTISGVFTITGEGEAFAGDTVDKVGRTTGWTSGAVSNECANTGVQGTSIVLICQTFVTGVGQIVAGGDSGSPVFARTGSNNNVTLLGGLWGGNQSGTLFVYSPIANIEAELGPLTTTK